MKHRHASPFGAQLGADGLATFRLWAPSQSRVSLHVASSRRRGAPTVRAMDRRDDGWHELALAAGEVGPGARYGFVVDGDRLVADPASRFNPDDVHDLSEVIDAAAYEWHDDGWRGRPWHEAVIYEMHIGTFTAAGTFAAAAEGLDRLESIGITAIEVMPVADFPGRRNWGYDGVLHYAPDATYGRPDELKAFVDRAHGLGLMVLLDVVYNHFGPDGNYLHGYCTEFFNPLHQTLWGSAINFDGEQRENVRAFYVHNALHWVSEYRFDGLRLDAVQAMADDTAHHIVLEIAEALAAGPGRDRHVHLVLENERNQASLLMPSHPVAATAQWNDDLHHAAHVLLTGEADSYYADYADAPAARFAKALAEGFVYQGEPSAFRRGKAHGEPSTGLPSTAFVSFLQNHDQIGNRAFGDRLAALAPAARLDAAYVCLLLSPHIPMLFMGEEFAASAPFLFFCDFDGELATAVTEGRRREFAHAAAFADESQRDAIPDPAAVPTFERSKLDLSEQAQRHHAQRAGFIAHLLALRHRHLVPRLARGAARGGHQVDGASFAIDWPLADGSRWWMLANFGERLVTAPRPLNATPVFGRAPPPLAATLELAPAEVWVGVVTP